MNFRTSEIDELWNVKSIKVPMNAATWHESNEILNKAFNDNNSIKLVIRGIDYNKMHIDTYQDAYDWYPTYLYDKNYLNDIEYLLNKEVLVESIFPEIKATLKKDTFTTTFDEYMNWMSKYPYGKDAFIALIIIIIKQMD